MNESVSSIPKGINYTELFGAGYLVSLSIKMAIKGDKNMQWCIQAMGNSTLPETFHQEFFADLCIGKNEARKTS